MSEKKVRLFIVDGGDTQLQNMIEAGLAKTGTRCEKTAVESGAAAVLDALDENEIAIVIKPV